MNKLTAIIQGVQVSPYMAVISAIHQGDVFSAAIQETAAGAMRFKEGQKVTLVFKETEVFLAKGLAGKISIRNRGQAVVKSVETAGVLTRVAMDYKGGRIAAVITAQGALSLDIKPGDHIEWLVKANEVSVIGG